MIETRYHGYPEPTLPTSEIMRMLVDESLVYAQMQDTFEPFLIDVVSGSRYAVPDEVDWLILTIAKKNKKKDIRG